MLAGTFLSIVLVSTSAIATLHFAIPVDGNIKTAGDAIGWAANTITTVA